jgi:capsular polysaccharide transport system permease protein
MSELAKRHSQQNVELTPVARDGEGEFAFESVGPVSTKVALRSFARRHATFLGIVVAPTLLVALYLGLIATNQYTSEARFIVRSVSGGGGLLSTLSSLGAEPGQSVAQAVATGTSFSRAADETYSVNEFIRSRDAVSKLEANNQLREIFSRHEADFISRFPNFFTRATREQLYWHYLKFVDVAVQSDNGISVLQVTTFRPEDSKNLALALLGYSEDLINKLNERARADSVRFAEDVVHDAEQKVEVIQAQMTDFRNRELVVDPSKQSDVALDLVTKLTTEAASERVQLESIQTLTPNSPQIEPLRNRLSSLESQIDQQRSLIVGGDQSMVDKLSRFEQLTLERDLAVKSLTSALVSRENSRQEAQRQQLYLERVVEPNLPDQSYYPRRLLWIGAVFGISLCVFWIVREFRTAILEHGP